MIVIYYHTNNKQLIVVINKGNRIKIIKCGQQTQTRS